MSPHENSLISDVLVNAAVKAVGKREFLKSVEKLYGVKEKLRVKSDVPADSQCLARCKGDRTGLKVGRYVLFDNVRCVRKEIGMDHLCAIHSNQTEKFGALPLGRFNEPLTEELKKVFGEL